MGKLLLEDFSPVQGAWIRYLSAWLVLLVGVAITRAPVRPIAPTRRDWARLLLAGALPFCFSPILQMTGLQASRATDNALIVAMEPTFTVLLAAFFLGERIQRYHLIAFAGAFMGFSLLAGIAAGSLAETRGSHLFGNLLLLASLTGEAAYTVLGRKLTQKFPATVVFTVALSAGILALTFFALATEGFPDFGKLTLRSAAGVFWLGPLGTGLAYLLWMKVLVRVPAATIAISLFLQPVMGGIWGHLFLGESLTFVQISGGALILLAVSYQSWRESLQSISGELHCIRNAQ
jgi:drug/metabolite transporter (DMT)-like permease